jgi:hypothetical protein
MIEKKKKNSRCLLTMEIRTPEWHCAFEGTAMIVNLAVRRRTKQYRISMMMLRAFFSTGGGYATRQAVLSAEKKELFSR